jgi:hypothetical protein
MSERATQLFDTADAQLSELIGLLSPQPEAALNLPCAGREKMGDGTVAACAAHTADRYRRIAEFLQAATHMSGARAGPGLSRHRLPGLLRVRGHGPGRHAEGEHGEGRHEGDYTAENVNLKGLIKRLSVARGALNVLRELTDEQLDTVPPADLFRFCDGQRTLERVIVALLKHQGHQIDAVKAAVA